MKCKEDSSKDAVRCNVCGNLFGEDDEEAETNFGKSFFYRWECPQCKEKNASENKVCGACGYNAETSSCYIATLLYGENSSEVNRLRQLRDGYLLNYKLGVLSVNLYYRYSKILVRRLKNKKLIIVIKFFLDVIIKNLEMFDRTRK
jgi:hypothetical protein